MWEKIRKFVGLRLAKSKQSKSCTGGKKQTTSNMDLIFQLAYASSVVPKILRQFLANGHVAFATYNVASDRGSYTRTIGWRWSNVYVYMCKFRELYSQPL